jgi:hypothetical protein
MADDRVRVEIGFQGGQVVGGFVDSTSADALESALRSAGDGGSGPRVVVLELEDGRYNVVVPLVSYFRRFNRAARVGFSAA